MIYILLIIVSIAVCYFLLTSFLGYKLPNRIKGQAYLKDKLKKAGFDITQIPDACLDEFITIAEKNAYMMSRFGKEKFLIRFVDGLDNAANMFILWRVNPNDSIFYYKSSNGENLYSSIFKRYGIKFNRSQEEK